jgi:hypothetical protein
MEAPRGGICPVLAGHLRNSRAWFIFRWPASDRNAAAQNPKKHQEFNMPIQTHEENGGTVLSIHISGKVVRSDFALFVPEFERLVREHGRLRVLFDITDFRGWAADALWDEVKFDVKHFADIERLAVIGAKKWHHGMASLFKTFTKATIRYFDHADSTNGRKWLETA